MARRACGNTTQVAGPRVAGGGEVSRLLAGASIGCLLFLLAGCTPSEGVRPALPTAMPGLSSQAPVSATSPSRVTAAALRGPTSTPAPFATKPPPLPKPVPKILHDTLGRTDCMNCHRAGHYAAPQDHLRRSNTTCLGCHVVDYNAVKVYTPPVPHAVTGREQCGQCHLWGTDGAPPMPGEHAGRAEDKCLVCHLESKGKKK